MQLVAEMVPMACLLTVVERLAASRAAVVDERLVLLDAHLGDVWWLWLWSWREGSCDLLLAMLEETAGRRSTRSASDEKSGPALSVVRCACEAVS